MIVPLLIASSMGNSVSPGTCRGQLGADVRKNAGCAHPAVLLRLLPALTVLADTDNDVQAVVAGVQTLAVALRAVADESKSVILEVVVKLGEGPIRALVNDLLGASEVESLDTTRLYT